MKITLRTWRTFWMINIQIPMECYWKSHYWLCEVICKFPRKFAKCFQWNPERCAKIRTPIRASNQSRARLPCGCNLGNNRRWRHTASASDCGGGALGERIRLWWRCTVPDCGLPRSQTDCRLLLCGLRRANSTAGWAAVRAAHRGRAVKRTWRILFAICKLPKAVGF